MDKTSIENFMQENPLSPTSKLSNFQQDIFYLRDKGYKLKDIVKYLETEQGVSTCIQNLSYFLKKHSFASENKPSNKLLSSYSHKKSDQKSEKEPYQPNWAKKMDMPTPKELLSKD